MKILLTGHKGYIGAVAGPMLAAAGYEVAGVDADLYAGCDFGVCRQLFQECQKDIRDLRSKISRALTPLCIWPHFQMIPWAASMQD